MYIKTASMQLRLFSQSSLQSHFKAYCNSAFLVVIFLNELCWANALVWRFKEVPVWPLGTCNIQTTSDSNVYFALAHDFKEMAITCISLRFAFKRRVLN